MSVPKKGRSEVAGTSRGGSLVKFEVIAINDSNYYGALTEEEIIHIWEKVLGRGFDEIYAMSYNRSLTRNFRVTIKSNFEASVSSIYPEPTFEFRRNKPNATSEDDVDVLTCRLIGYSSVKPAELGQLTRITVKTNDFAVEPEQILDWLAKFGSVSSNHDYERNTVGVRTDVLETEIVLRKHIPEYLPIAGRKVVVAYPGIPKVCNNCYQTGHMKRACKAKRVEWIDKVQELRGTGDFPDEMFGGWISIIEQRK